VLQVVASTDSFSTFSSTSGKLSTSNTAAATERAESRRLEIQQKREERKLQMEMKKKEKGNQK
jgi:septal ring factor EnvC (AmiA/AmiB activator)